MEITTLQVGDDENGERIDRFVAARCAPLSRSRVQDLLKCGGILRNGSIARPSEPIHTGDTISIAIPPATTPESLKPEEIPLSILFEDRDLIVINKPAGLVVHPGAGNSTGTLVHALLHHCTDLSGIGGIERPGIVHRLDRETSGCLVVAKNDATHQDLSRQFADRAVEKIYLAIACGSPARKQGTIDAPIARHPVHRQKMAIAAAGKGRSAITDYKVLQSSDGLSLIECHPKTGRTHQIRVHLKHLGHPIAGDPVYGRRGPYSRHLLHAWQLHFAHPATGIRLSLRAPVPADFPLAPSKD